MKTLSATPVSLFAGFKIKTHAVAGYGRPAVGFAVATLAGKDRLRRIPAVEFAEEYIAARVETGKGLIHTEIGVVIAPLPVFGLVVNRTAFNLNFAGGEVTLEIRPILNRVPQAPLKSAHHAYLFGQADLVFQGKPVYLCLLLHPSLLCTHPYIESRFVNALLYDRRFDALFFSATATGWRAQVLERIRTLAELTRQAPDDSALEVQSQFYALWALLFTNTIHPAENEKTMKKLWRNGKTLPLNEC
jgi:hypothetical protein